ncbi:hypothetical protein CNBD4130 [Cryptococcus deneoformans B-3501A]|uniref:Short-chain dehydrogenase/reductase SDR n=1 Tax=Cryptococcus deneoformans (strain JEC21 / ATCC MYA-565) TaxID=214684 RepID=Q5KIP5_CRYD1|nr:conserved hypothetical protein [Cryptococcus neoformans var. neoformans JEC21]XP_775684.1 hypothetical protein CNBD4130 [Cryptococcus neoformans var. neoformans B-3501A]AAW43123.1 conserved hypothetical protein [Cryptococcus neoformans var. neoformans JEC21]EAL21037.1 hypothetical protein CNBD4130 [Cryptococcus neoformans var. neoformans B-3501A]
MASSEVLHPKAVAVITGAASGIGLAAALRYAKEGASIVLVDIDPAALDPAVEKVKSVEGVGTVFGVRVDVGNVKEVASLRDRVLEEFGEVHILMANAGTSTKAPTFSLGTPLEELQSHWNKVLNTNFFGVLNTAQAFAPFMVKQENSSVIIITGSKQGITCPPGNAGYNVSKAAVKTYAEQLSHELRSDPDSRCTAHLFIPGWVFTSLTGANNIGATKPPGAWTPEQTVDYMVDKVFGEGDFYVICPDNETPTSLDKARIQWSMDDVIQNRPALSRWHPSYKARFEDFIQSKQGLAARSRSRGRPAQRDGSQVPSVVSIPSETDLLAFRRN